MRKIDMTLTPQKRLIVSEVKYLTVAYKGEAKFFPSNGNKCYSLSFLRIQNSASNQ